MPLCLLNAYALGLRRASMLAWAWAQQHTRHQATQALTLATCVATLYDCGGFSRCQRQAPLGCCVVLRNCGSGAGGCATGGW
jgi:hypothetical protein